MATVGDAVAAHIGRPLREVEVLEIYSCFPVAVRVQQRELDLDRLAASGAKWLRVDVAATQFTWDGPTQFHWAPLDEVVAGAEKRGLKVLGVIESLPVYDRPAGTTMWYGPKTDLERAAFAPATGGAPASGPAAPLPQPRVDGALDIRL